ncbi:MAG TPA: hypothetical protein DCK76_08460 [Desulfotomaculum sp.]|nr:MAG: Uncharacterized protein XD84_0578 [Desulfotomaculum sp. 46_80]HAG11394.1 hypothetical protein [Desulfotomaculum sp.]HBY05180.1 hypothetical protein [Desulfotomaculum sp.]
MLEIKPQSKFKLNEDFILHQIEELDKYWLFNIVNGDIFNLNDVSMFILQKISEGNNFESLVFKLLQQFDVDENRAQNDLQKILRQLFHEKIISQIKED